MMHPRTLERTLALMLRWLSGLLFVGGLLAFIVCIAGSRPGGGEPSPHLGLLIVLWFLSVLVMYGASAVQADADKPLTPGEQKLLLLWEQDQEQQRLQAERDRVRRIEQEAVEAARRHENQQASDRKAARAEVERYYRNNQSVLHAEIPPALFRSKLNAAVPGQMSPEKAWGAARDLIAQLLPVVREQSNRQRAAQEAARRRRQRLDQIDRAIAAREKDIARSGSDPEREEIQRLELEEQLSRLREERQTLLDTQEKESL